MIITKIAVLSVAVIVVIVKAISSIKMFIEHERLSKRIAKLKKVADMQNEDDTSH
jgi:hypothetical protein